VAKPIPLKQQLTEHIPQTIGKPSDHVVATHSTAHLVGLIKTPKGYIAVSAEGQEGGILVLTEDPQGAQPLEFAANKVKKLMLQLVSNL
jgi:hypothetical protein